MKLLICLSLCCGILLLNSTPTVAGRIREVPDTASQEKLGDARSKSSEVPSSPSESDESISPNEPGDVAEITKPNKEKILKFIKALQELFDRVKDSSDGQVPEPEMRRFRSYDDRVFGKGSKKKVYNSRPLREHKDNIRHSHYWTKNKPFDAKISSNAATRSFGIRRDRKFVKAVKEMLDGLQTLLKDEMFEGIPTVDTLSESVDEVLAIMLGKDK